MKRFKGLLALMLVLSLMTALLGGCGSKPAEDNAATDENTQQAAAVTTAQDDPYKDPMEISIATWDIETYMASAETDPLYQSIAKKLNISIKPIGLTWDDYGQKIQVWASSGQLPDVFSIDAIGTQYYRKWITQGVVKALPDLNQYPNLDKYMDTPDIQGLAEDGKFYCVPRKTYPSLDYNAVDRLVEYRWDLAQKAGITKEPETWDEFKDMLKAIVQKDPEGKKIAGLTAVNVKQIGGLFWLFSNPAATSDGSGTDYKWIKEDGKFIPAVFSKNSLSSLQNMRDMYAQGLIDKDIALTKGDQGYDKFVSGKVAAVLHGGGYTTTTKKLYSDRWVKINKDINYSDAVKALKPLKSPDGNAYHAVFKSYWSESYFNSSLDDKKFDRILKLYDYLLSDEGHELLRFGIKDTDYTKNGDQITVIDQGKALAEKYPALPVFHDLAEWDQGFAYDLNSPQIDNAIRQTAHDYMENVKATSKMPEFDIRLTYLSTPAKDKFSILDHDDMLNVLLSKDPVDKVWGEIVNSYKAKGLDKVIEEVNAKAAEMEIN